MNTLKAKKSPELTDFSVISLRRLERIDFKMIASIVISLLISTPISAYINGLIKDYIDGSYGVYVNTLISLLVTTTIISLFVRFLIINPLNKVEGAIKQAAQGDLTVAVNSRSNDEIGRLSHSFDKMVANLGDLLEKSNQTVIKVSDYSTQLNSIAEENTKAIDAITSTIQEVAAGSEGQAKSSAKLVIASKEIAEGMEQSAAAIQSVAKTSMSASGKAAKGNAAAVDTVKRMQEIRQSVGETSELLQALDSKSDQIGEIVKMITSIADQTNLLALNATIEAARAGEHGRGFAVVAEEVRKLAEQSGNAGDKIRFIIQEIQSETNKAVQSMNQGRTIIESGIVMVDRTGDSFKEITGDIENVSRQTHEVSAIIEQVNASTVNMLTMIENIAVIADQTSGSIQTVSAASEEQAASMQEIASNVNMLNGMSRDLRGDLSRFKVNGEL
ncbi:methyl-accepting chemotaxis protein [Rossellomorea vietnamensis]|uniref:Methyl-accepting chemotaxis protein n=1 Tax=Rossellomorea vietnamensis TaxID=218284 RepID=A0ACD4CDX5_9BACI|nr:HAMP domain-containing methyl-accepting chemotaxis protein [Rossellomorea vietnamensis]UXH46481.1 methyl-accepting chemotaxis protein [Rossellomorea vietnamensis]